jgi:FKBP-type peptidyl-prolyl cis-trans isomerase SlyD
MSEPVVSHGKHIQLTYSVTDKATGEVLEQTDIPITFEQGNGKGIFQSLENGLEGHKVGESVTVSMSPEEGFGEYLSDLTFEDDVDNVPEEYRQVGAEAQFQNESGDVKTFVVTKIENGKVLLDGNHPFAGKTVVFTMKIVSIADEKPEDGQAMSNPNDSPTKH